MRQEQQPQQGGFAGARRAGQKLERMRQNLEIEIAQHFGAKPVTQPDIFESDHGQLRSTPFPGQRRTIAIFFASKSFRRMHLTSPPQKWSRPVVIPLNPCATLWFPIR